MPGTRKMVVCIEDDPDIIMLIRLMLRSTGFEIIGAVGGREGLETVRNIKPDLVLLDLMMPEVDGWQVYDELQGNTELQSIPVIAVTCKSSIPDRQRGFEVFGRENYITKPIVEEILLRSVNLALGIHA